MLVLGCVFLVAILQSGCPLGMLVFQALEACEADPACRGPLPSNNGVDSAEAEPTEQVVPSPGRQIQPNFQWDAFSGLGEAVTYELRIWRAKVGWRQVQQGSVVYEREGITQPSHQIEMPLEPSTHYLWAVRTHFQRDGQKQITPWSYENVADAPDEPQYYHFWTPASRAPSLFD